MALKLKDRNFRLIAADIMGDLPVLEKTAVCPVIMLGSEGGGLSDGLLDLADEKVRIPMNGRKAESLNVAASGAILMFLWNGNQT
jgi:tRNA G18 (ribose-2'-O)-methylase SpoU